MRKTKIICTVGPATDEDGDSTSLTALMKCIKKGLMSWWLLETNLISP